MCENDDRRRGGDVGQIGFHPYSVGGIGPEIDELAMHAADVARIIHLVCGISVRYIGPWNLRIYHKVEHLDHRRRIGGRNENGKITDGVADVVIARREEQRGFETGAAHKPDAVVIVAPELQPRHRVALHAAFFAVRYVAGFNQIIDAADRGPGIDSPIIGNRQVRQRVHFPDHVLIDRLRVDVAYLMKTGPRDPIMLVGSVNNLDDRAYRRRVPFNAHVVDPVIAARASVLGSGEQDPERESGIIIRQRVGDRHGYGTRPIYTRRNRSN